MGRILLLFNGISCCLSTLICSISNKNAVELLALPGKINIKPNLITINAAETKKRNETIHSTPFAFGLQKKRESDRASEREKERQREGTE